MKEGKGWRGGRGREGERRSEESGGGEEKSVWVDEVDLIQVASQFAWLTRKLHTTYQCEHTRRGLSIY